MTKVFKCGDHTLKGYYVKAGQGWEIGYKIGNKTCFVSNFVNQTEATKWWDLSQKLVTGFSKTVLYPTINVAFLSGLVGNYLNTEYYGFLKGIISKNHSVSQKIYRKDFAQFKKVQRSIYA